jgi:hypothetical protein
LRWGELAGHQRADIDCDRKTVRIARQLCEVAGREPFLAPPKSDAGKRTVSMPSLVLADVSSHLDTFTQLTPMHWCSRARTACHCGTPTSVAVSGFRRAPRPASAFTCTTCAIPVTSSSEAGGNLRELMERMGHSTSRAALIYLHSTSPRQRHLADAVTARARSELGKTDEPSNGGVARTWHDTQNTDDSAS